MNELPSRSAAPDVGRRVVPGAENSRSRTSEREIDLTGLLATFQLDPFVALLILLEQRLLPFPLGSLDGPPAFLNLTAFVLVAITKFFEVTSSFDLLLFAEFLSCDRLK